MTNITQTCQVCAHQSKCWSLVTNKGKPISTSNVIINTMICRLQLNINRDKAAANLIKIYRPGMIRLISHIRQSGSQTGIDIDQLLLDMQSTMIEYLLYDYKIGDRGRATPYLFDPHQGFLTKWVKWIVGKNRRFYSHHELYSPLEGGNSEEDEEYQPMSTAMSHTNGDSWQAILEGGDLRYDPYADTNETAGAELTKNILNIVNDGHTLSSSEYRTFTYCMTHANDANNTRLIDGTHLQLAEIMGVSRPRITRLFARAQSKILSKYKSLTAKELS